MDAHAESIRTVITKAAKPPFFVKGTWSLPQDTVRLFYKAASGCQVISFPEATPEELGRLSAACQPATFGLNKEDVLDDSYRNAGKLDRGDFAINLQGGGAKLERAAHALSENSEISLELYKLNVYGPGSFFKAHKDTPRGDKMFASLVIVLPTNFEGGQLLVRHDGDEYSYDATEDFKNFKKENDGMSMVSWAAFYSDVEHEVLPVKSGYRVTLTYNLYRSLTDNKLSSEVPTLYEDAVRNAIQAAISDPGFLPSGGLLGFGLSHSYAQSLFRQIDRPSLKGADASLMSAIESVGLIGEIKAIYLPDNIGLGYLHQYSYVMSSEFPLLDNHMEIRDDEKKGLIEDGGGKIFKSEFWHPLSEDNEAELRNRERHAQELKEDRYGYRRDGETPLDDTTPVVNWIVPLSETNRRVSSYIHYGNEASTSYLYANMNIIVDVPSADKRKAQ